MEKTAGTAASEPIPLERWLSRVLMPAGDRLMRQASLMELQTLFLLMTLTASSSGRVGFNIVRFGYQSGCTGTLKLVVEYFLGTHSVLCLQVPIDLWRRPLPTAVEGKHVELSCLLSEPFLINIHLKMSIKMF